MGLRLGEPLALLSVLFIADGEPELASLPHLFLFLF